MPLLVGIAIRPVWYDEAFSILLAKQGDVVVHSNKLTYLPSFYFDCDLPQSYLMDTLGGSTDTLSPATRTILRLTDQENIEYASADAARVWFVIFHQSMDEYSAQGYKTHPQLEYLDQHFTLESTETWADVKVYLYKRNP